MDFIGAPLLHVGALLSQNRSPLACRRPSFDGGAAVVLRDGMLLPDADGALGVDSVGPSVADGCPPDVDPRRRRYGALRDAGMWPLETPVWNPQILQCEALTIAGVEL